MRKYCIWRVIATRTYRRVATTPEDYYSIIDGKTAGPFATACSCAAIIAGASEEVINSLDQFGWEVGRAFQLVDDLLDLLGMRKWENHVEEMFMKVK